MATEAVPALLERERELTRLRLALTEASEGRGQFILIEAPAGFGKTSLLRAASQVAGQAGFACFRARAGELERGFAYGCVRQLLEPVVAKSAGTKRERLFEGAATLSKALFLPSRGQQPAADSIFSMLHGLYWLLNNLAAENPVAICIDDLHWSDAESLRFLNYLAPRLDGLRVAVLASTRTERNVAADLARLSAGFDTTVLRPKPLGIEATATLCERRLGAKAAPDFAAACRAATGGNPFFLEALLREVKEQKLSPDAQNAARVHRIGPAAVAKTVALRLAGAPAAATALVHASAILGDGASVIETARLAELALDDAVRAADLLIALAVFKAAERIEFAHPILREAVYADIGSHERARAHARAAQILARGGAADERIAAQIAVAAPSGEADRIDLLRRVAASALARGAPRAAAAALRRALAEPPPASARAEVLLELGSAELRLAMPEAIEHLTAAAEDLRQPALLAKTSRQLANALTMTGRADRAVAALESAIAAVEPVDRELALLLTAELAAKSQQASREMRAPAAQRLHRHADLTGATRGERLVLASIAFERARASESANEAVEHIDRALAGGRLLDDLDLDVVGPFYALVIGLLATDGLDLADPCIERSLSDARARASIPAIAFLLAHRGWFSLRRGAVALAEADARAALELLNAHDIRLGNRFALALLVAALIESGAIDAAERELAASGLDAEIPPGLANNDLLETRGLLRIHRGNTRAGLEDLFEFGKRDELWGGANPLASRWRSRTCLALAAGGACEEARHLAAEDLDRAQRWGAASGIGLALRATAVVEGGARSIDLLRESADVLQRSPARLEHAHALVELGAALRRANHRADARGWLQEGFDLATRCGARALAERADTELRAAGGRPSGPASAGLQALTISERRVAELAAQGRSNPEIAQTLFVTRKTVETHLGRVYSKLDIPGRMQLARALASQPSPRDR